MAGSIPIVPRNGPLLNPLMPATPEDLFAALDRLGIAHPTVTIPRCSLWRKSQALRGAIPGGHTKNIVGLPDKAVAESRERVRAALIASGLALPAKRITVNLAPADLPKEGSHYDLPIALGLLAAMGAIPHDALAGFTRAGRAGARRLDRAGRRRAARRDRRQRARARA